MLGGMENKAITFSPGKNLKVRTWRAENATIYGVGQKNQHPQPQARMKRCIAECRN